MRYVVEVKARVEADGEVGFSAGYRVYESKSEAHELFFDLRCHMVGGIPHRGKNGAVVSVLSARMYETDAASEEDAKRQVRAGTAKLLSEGPLAGEQAA